MEPTESRSRRSSSRRAEALAAVLLAPLAFAAGGKAAQQASPPAERTIVIDAGVQRFAVPDCIPRSGDSASIEACRTLTRVLRDDLKFEGLFQFVPESLFAALPAWNPDSPKFDDWKGIGAKILVVARAQVVSRKDTPEPELTAEVRVWFVDSGQSMLAKRYSGRADNPRIFAHQASDDIMTLTQYRGVARTRIAFSSDRNSTKEGISKELYIADYDGYNARRVTVNGSINILPAWNPDGRSLAYVSYRQRTPVVFLASIYEGRSTANLTGERSDSQAFAPAFSPDGKRMTFASNRTGSMEIWVANADGSSPRKVTSSPSSSDTAPCFSPTGQEIAFTSDRTGSPQIFVMDSEGLNVRRLTRVGNYNDAPAWNPSKQYSEIAYTSRLEGGGFDIAVVDLGSGQVRQITQGRGSCEYPAWAPNGRHLVFSCKRGDTWQLAVADREGRDFQILSTGPGNNVYPDWGP